MKVASLACDVLLCTHFSQTLKQQGAVTQTTGHVEGAVTPTTERVVAVWSCPCRQGCILLSSTVCVF